MKLFLLIAIEAILVICFVIIIAYVQRKGSKNDLVLLFKNYYQKKDKVLPKKGMISEAFMLEFWRAVFLIVIWVLIAIFIYSDLIGSASATIGLIVTVIIGWLYACNKRYTGTLFYEIVLTTICGFNISLIVDPTVREWASWISFDTSYLQQPLMVGVWMFVVSFAPGFVTTFIRYRVWKNAMKRKRNGN